MASVAEASEVKVSKKMSEKSKSSRASQIDDKIAQARNKNLELAISQIQKDFGEAAIMRLGDDTSMDVDSIPTVTCSLTALLGSEVSLEDESSRSLDQRVPVRPL